VTQVDILGDEVDALLSILGKIYIALDHYSPVLKHYPGVRQLIHKSPDNNLALFVDVLNMLFFSVKIQYKDVFPFILLSGYRDFESGSESIERRKYLVGSGKTLTLFMKRLDMDRIMTEIFQYFSYLIAVGKFFLHCLTGKKD
jgi:hypothetical protein